MIDTFIKRRIKEPTIDVQVATWGSVLKNEEIGCFEKENFGEVLRGFRKVDWGLEKGISFFWERMRRQRGRKEILI